VPPPRITGFTPAADLVDEAGAQEGRGGFDDRAEAARLVR
jgi:hypothetical protein